MFKPKFLTPCFLLINLFFPLFGTVFFDIDTTQTLFCTFSNKFQNRILVENGKVQKVISSDDEKLSIFIEEISGQAFILARESDPEETTLSVITNEGIIQDIQIAFSDKSSEVIVLNGEEIFRAEEPKVETKGNFMEIVSEILLGNIPEGYFACQIQCQQWKPKKGITLDLIAKLEGAVDDLYLYRICNRTKSLCELMECELQFSGCRWIFLETNSINPKQDVIGIISVGKNE